MIQPSRPSDLSTRLYDSDHANVYERHRGVHLGVLSSLLALEVGRPPARVLEVGCGTANYAGALSDLTDASLWGIDPSSKMLAQARAGAGAPQTAVIFNAAQAEALPFAAGSFDLVYSVDVAHHIGDLNAAFAEAARVLRPGGHLLTATDSEATIRARVPLSSHFPETVPQELARYPSVTRLEILHRRHGLRIVDAFVVEMPYTLSDLRPFRTRAYSCLHLISDRALAAGVRRLEAEIPVSCVSRNYVIVARPA